MRDPQPFEAVAIVWEDAFANACAQFDSAEAALESYRPKIRRTIGFWIGRAHHNGAEAILIATDDDRCAESPHGVGGLIFTPVAMIRRIEPLCRAPKPPRRKKRA